MAHEITVGREAFIIPGRTLQGSKQEMIDDLDQAIVGLLALRQLIDDAAPAPDRHRLAGPGPRSKGRRPFWCRLAAAILPLGFGGQA